MFQHINTSTLNSQFYAPQYSFSKSSCTHPLPLAKSSNTQTTSIDGRPFLTPEQFGSLWIKERQGPLNKTYAALATQNQLKYRAMLNRHGLVSSNPFVFQSELLKRPSPCLKENINDDTYSVYKRLKVGAENLEKLSLEDDIEYLKQDFKLVETQKKTQMSPQKIMCQTVSPMSQSNKKFVKKIYGVQYEESQQDLIFKVELEPEDDLNVPLEARLTRRDLLERDPLALLYFYEQQLQFSKCQDFNSENLIKI